MFLEKIKKTCVPLSLASEFCKWRTKKKEGEMMSRSSESDQNAGKTRSHALNKSSRHLFFVFLFIFPSFLFIYLFFPSLNTSEENEVIKTEKISSP